MGKIGHHDIERVARICAYLDALISKKDQLSASVSKRKQKKAKRLDAAVTRMRRKIKHLQNEIHRKTVAFLVLELDIIIIPPFEISNMVKCGARKITRSTVWRAIL